MALIPVFKNVTREYLMEEWELEFPLADSVKAEVEGNMYNCNRYDVKYRDSVMGKTISVYIYMNEDSNEVIAIDEIVKDKELKVSYLLEDTPFADILEDMQEAS